MATAQLIGGSYSPDLSPLGLITSDTVDRTSTTLSIAAAIRAQLIGGSYSPALGVMLRISAFGLTSNEAIVLGTGTSTPVTTQSWYIS